MANNLSETSTSMNVGGAGALTPGGYAVRITPGISSYGGNNVNHGYFYDLNVLTNVTGVFFWEAWVMPEAGAEYVISDGHGGAHKLLFGFGGGNPLTVSGNIWNSTGAVVQSFTSLDTVPANTLQHIAVGWDGTNIAVYVNGVRSNTIAYSGDRGNLGSSGTLYVGGSDHSNFDGWIYRIRGFEGVIPFTSGLPTGIFTPERIFRAAFRNSSSGATVPANFLADYTTPMRYIPDLSAGYDGSTHPGVLSVGNDDGLIQEGLKNYDPDEMPTFEEKVFEQTAYAGTAPSDPGSAILFDEFRRVDSVPAWASAPTVAGRTAPTGQLWSSDVGILSEKLYIWGNTTIQPSISHTQADIDLTVTNGNTARNPYFFLRKNGNTYLQVSLQNFGGPIKVVLDEVVAGVTTNLATSADVGSLTWSTLRVVANGTDVDVYRNGASVISNAVTSVTTGTNFQIVMDPLDRLDKIEGYAP